MRKYILAVVLVIAVFSLAIPGYCANYNNWGNTDLDPILRRELPYDLVYLGAGRSGTSVMVTGSTAVPLGYDIVKIIITTRACTIANGIPGQVITIIGVDDQGTVTLTPATSTGWTSAAIADDGDALTLKFVDSTYGWIVIGNVGITVTQKDSGV